LVESYRHPDHGQPRVRTVQKLEGLPILERATIIFKQGGQKHLRSEEWEALNDAGLLANEKKHTDVEGVFSHVGDVYSGGGTAVAFHHLKESGMFGVLDECLSRTSSSILRELIVHQLTKPKSKLRFAKQRTSSLLYLLEGKRVFKEDAVYRAMDELHTQMSAIIRGLNKQVTAPNNRLLLYDLSNSYFTGTKAELGGRGQSKEKRHDRYIVSYGLVMNSNNMPLDIRIWKGGTADSKTVAKTFEKWKETYKAKQAIWVADRSMSGQPTLDDIQKLGLDYITGLPGNSQQAALLIEHESQPELFDQANLATIHHNGKRLVLCRHFAKGYRKAAQAAERRRKIYQKLKKIQQSPRNKHPEKLYHRAAKVLEKYGQAQLWNIWTEPFEDTKKQKRYRLHIRFDRKEAQVRDKLGHFYLLQSNLSEAQMSNEEVQQNYHQLMRVEKGFRDIKSHVKLRPIRHWKRRRIMAHIYLCYLSLWLSKYIENKWSERGINVEVALKLTEWDQDLLLCEKIDSQKNIKEVGWNKGQRAQKAYDEIKKHSGAKALQIGW
jgi:transposase